MKPTFIALLALCLCVVGCGKSSPVDESTLADDDQSNPQKPLDLKSYLLTGKRIVFGLPAKNLAMAQNSECRANMQTLRFAIGQWVVDKRLADDAKVTLDDFAPYLKAGTKSLKCPAGGKYILTTVGKDPKCSHGHSLDNKRGDKLPPAKGPPPRAFWQFNKDGTLQMGKFDENGDAVDESRTVKMTYKVTGPMEVTLEVEGKEVGAKLVFTKPNPAKGDALTLKHKNGREELSKASILEVTLPPTNSTDQNVTKAEPVRELTPEERQKKALRDSVVGEYEAEIDGDTIKWVFLKNGNFETYTNSKKREGAKWSIIKEGEIHAVAEDGRIVVLRINVDGSLISIAVIKDKFRIEVPKELQLPLKKIK